MFVSTANRKASSNARICLFLFYSFFSTNIIPMHFYTSQTSKLTSIDPSKFEGHVLKLLSLSYSRVYFSNRKQVIFSDISSCFVLMTWTISPCCFFYSFVSPKRPSPQYIHNTKALLFKKDFSLTNMSFPPDSIYSFYT